MILLMLPLGLLAGTLGGIVGTGGTVILLPALVLALGPHEAIPIMAVAAVMANLARVMAWWHEIRVRVFLAYGLPAVPAAMLGARTLLDLPAEWVDAALGVFFLLLIPVRRRLRRHPPRLRLAHLVAVGATIGFLTGLLLSTGPLSVAAVAALGLTKGALLGTEGAISLLVYIAKTAAFGQASALPPGTLLKGVLLGLSLMAGTFAVRRVVLRLRVDTSERLLDGILLLASLPLFATLFR